MFLLPFVVRPVGLHGLGDRPAGRHDRGRRGRLPRGARPDRRARTISDDELLRAKALIETDELGALQRVARAGRPAQHVRDPPRRARRDQPPARALPGGDRRRTSGPPAPTLLVEHNRVVLTYVPAGGGAPAEEEARGGGRGRGDDGDGPGGPLEDGMTEARHERARSARGGPRARGRSPARRGHSHFPPVERGRLSGGLPVRAVHLPGRPLVSASLILPMGAVDEPAGDRRRDRPRGPRADRGHPAPRRRRPRRGRRAPRRVAPRRGRLGRDGRRASRCRPSAWRPALELLAEVVREPAFPPREVERLRDQRLNDLLQAKVDPARRADEVVPRHDLRPGEPVRPAGRRPPRDRRRRSTPAWSATAYAQLGRASSGPRSSIGGDLAGIDLPAILEPLLGDLGPVPGAVRPAAPTDAGRLDRPVGPRRPPAGLRPVGAAGRPPRPAAAHRRTSTRSR